MRCLLDSCTFIWLATDPAKLSEPAVEVITNPENSVLLSDCTIWGIVLKYSAGKLPLRDAPRIWIPERLQFFEIGMLPITTEALVRSGELPSSHKDPFDRLIVAQAITDGLRIISPDSALQTLEADLLW